MTAVLTLALAGAAHAFTVEIVLPSSYPVLIATDRPQAFEAVAYDDQQQDVTSEVTWSWDFDDGSDPDTDNPTEHVFETAGDYTVTVTGVWSAQQQQDDSEVGITAQDETGTFVLARQLPGGAYQSLGGGEICHTRYVIAFEPQGRYYDTVSLKRGALLQVNAEGEAIVKRNRRLIVGVTAAGALLLTALVAVIRADYSPRSRDAVASFLSTDAEDLQFVARVDDDGPRARGVLEFWRWTDPDSAGIVDVAAAVEPARVIRAEWQNPSPSGGAPSLPKAGALPLALTWASRFAGFRPAEEPSYLLMELGGGRWAHRFTWRGLGPEDETHAIRVLIDAATGEPIACSAIYWPLRTVPTMPVRLTQEEARDIAAAAAGEVEGLRVTTLDVADVRTTSPFRPPGEPVYVVTIEGGIVPSGADRECGYADTWGVHATTGELLKVVWEPEG